MHPIQAPFDARLSSCCALLMTVMALHSGTAEAQGQVATAVPVQFNRDIRPILAAHCFDCHGFDAKQRKADLRLDTAEGASADHDGVVAVTPGDLNASELWNRVTSEDPEVVMPPPSSKKTLTADQKDKLKRWIEQGAPYQQHWAFEPPAAVPEPSVGHATWPRTPVDRFVLSRLEQMQLTPLPEADRETLIRRVSFVLTGLPPTVSEVDQFLADASPQAYETMVDRFLASPRYGEEQARHWLDVARYADTHGLHLDNEREMWAYRDWVIRAFNQNLPFDQFTTWQLAGDLLPQPSQDQLVATGFNRCNVTTSEGGAIAEEWLYRYAVDRTSTMMQAWMGLTAGCAVCHDHKYDPVTQQDFYSMYAFFYSGTDPAMDGNIRNTTPFLKVPTSEQQAALSGVQDHVDQLRKQLETALITTEYSEPSATGSVAAARDISDVLIDDVFPKGARVRNTSRNAIPWSLNPEFGARSGQRSLEMAYGSQFDLTVELTLIPVVVPEDGRLQLWLRSDPFHPPASFVVQVDDGTGTRRAVWGTEVEGKNAKTADMGPVPPAGEWVPLSIPLSQLGCEPRARIRSIVLQQTGGRVWVDDVRVSGRLPADVDPLSSFQTWWQLSQGTKPDGVPAELSAVLTAGPKDDVTAERRSQLLRFYLQHVHRIADSPVAPLRQQLQDAEFQMAAISDTIPGTFTFGDLEKPRDAFVMKRGQYDKPGDPVVPGVPAAFPPLKTASGQRLPVEQRANRLDLVRWLLADDNPLTARVTVNRIWQQLFGTGLVKTSDDFGTRGDLPSHPELLDWLAVQFRSSGWDIKQLYRLLLTSAAFRQQAVISPTVYQQDPENRLLARGPRFRLDAEQLRDNVLYVSGLMNLTMGGRGVMPYQPPDIWEPVGYENSNTRFYMQDHGESLYRRSVYCFLKRTAPPPFMSNFDGPNREQFCTRRERSNTPLQALQLMNDVQHFEAARALAERAIVEAGSSAEERIEFLYRTVLSRRPDADEQKLIRDALQVQRQLFDADAAAAASVVRVGESASRRNAADAETAAWTMIANLVLNLDETVTRN